MSWQSQHVRPFRMSRFYFAQRLWQTGEVVLESGVLWMRLLDWFRGVFMMGRGNEDARMDELQSSEDLADALARSHEAVVLIFKHSTRCPISASALARFGQYLDTAGDEAPASYLLKVVEARAVSNEVAEKLGVAHQSPQALLVKDGAVLWHASHGAITGEAIADALARA